MSSISELLTTMEEYSARSPCDKSSLCISDEKPTMALRGVRISWLILAKNADLSRSDSSAHIRASTSEVYGAPLIHPQPEEYWSHVNPLGTRSCYDEDKRCAESLMTSYHRQHGVKVKIIRYGPRMDINDGRVASNFIVQALRDEDITIYGNGMQTRSFQHIDDLLEGMVRMMATPANFTGSVNMGNPHEFTMLERTQEVIALTGSKSKLVFMPLPADDPQQRKSPASPWQARCSAAGSPPCAARGVTEDHRLLRRGTPSGHYTSLTSE